MDEEPLPQQDFPFQENNAEDQVLSAQSEESEMLVSSEGNENSNNVQEDNNSEALSQEKMEVENELKAEEEQDAPEYRDNEDISMKKEERTNVKQILSLYDSKKSHPVLNGHYINDGENCIWTGLWGMGTDGIIKSGNGIDFRFTMKLPERSQPGKIPQDGIYNGYFWMRSNNNPPQRVSENNVHLHFDQDENDEVYIIKGEGQNRIGPFDLVGVYNPTTSKMTCEKYYLSVKNGSHSKSVKKPSKNRSEALWTQSRVATTPSAMSTRSNTLTSSYLRNTSTPRGLTKEMTLCYKCVRKLMNHKWAGPFLYPVDAEALNIPDYYTIIKEPMDFSTICSYIENQSIRTKAEFDHYMNLVFNNALLYNKEGSDVNTMAQTLKEIYEKESTIILGQIYAAGEDAYKSSYVVPSRRERSIPMDDYVDVTRVTKKPKVTVEKPKVSKRSEKEKKVMELTRMVSQLERKVNAYYQKNEKTPVDSRPMTKEEKKALGMDINQLNSQDLEGLLNIIQAHSTVDQSSNNNEFEIDMDTLPNEVLRKMEKYIMECKQAKIKHKKQRKTYNHAPREKTIDFDENVEFDFDETDDSIQDEY